MSTEDSITKPRTAERTREERGAVAEAAEKLVTTLFDIGRLWAAHGLGVGRSALNASAETLRATAEALGELSRKLEPTERSEGSAT
ncbi:MAG TPA: hypothetical protein VIL20_17615 [Sandaracinaceae bacterium]